MHMKQLCRHSAPTTILHPFASHVKPPHTYRNNNNRLNSIRAAMGTKHPKENFYQESCNPCGVIGGGGGGAMCVSGRSCRSSTPQPAPRTMKAPPNNDLEHVCKATYATVTASAASPDPADYRVRGGGGRGGGRPCSTAARPPNYLLKGAGTRGWRGYSWEVGRERGVG